MNEEYTFTFEKDEEGRFRNILSRLDPDEYVITEDLHLVEPDHPRTSDVVVKIQMEPEAASTFRFGMKRLVIRRTRTEEELAAEKEREEKSRVSITVRVNGLPTP